MLTPEEIARREWELMTEPDKVRVRVKVSWVNGMCLPDENGRQYEEAVFKVLSVGDNHILEAATSFETVVGKDHYGREVTAKSNDINEYRRLSVKRNLLSWSLDIPIERDASGWMTPACYERVSRVPAPLLEAFILDFEKTSEIDKEEESKINRQSILLFSKHGHGVSDACEAVSMFCTLGNYWEKFGINRDDLPNLPYKDFLRLKIMIGKEGEASRSSTPSSGRPTSKIAGAGGRTRASRGVIVGEA